MSCAWRCGVKSLESASGSTCLGLAHGPGILEFIAAHPSLVDYVEVPFEQLRHAPQLGSIREHVPVILHCASMSVAGFIPPSETTIEAISQ